jgi:signal transduction histidine kinase
LADGKAGPLELRQQRFVENVLLSSRHLLDLINDLLDLAKIEAGRLEFHPEPVSSCRLVEEAVESLRPLMSAKQIRFQYEVDDGVDALYTDAARFKQIIYNYLSNAIKFTPSHGEVRVKTSPQGPEMIRIDVTDSGIGIDPADLGKLFQQFQQLDTGPAKRFAGTGLGLALVKKLVTLLGGRVECSSTPGIGSCFSAVLPRDCAVLNERSG